MSDALKTELTTDPLARGYAGLSDAEATANINDDTTAALKRTLPKGGLTGDELFTATAAGEFAALADARQQMWVSWCGTSRDPYNAANVAFVRYIFGADSATQANLQALRVRTVSRAVELGLGKQRVGDIQMARAN